MSSDEYVAGVLAHIRDAGKFLLALPVSGDAPHSSLLPLGIGLLQLADLLTRVTQSDASNLRCMFSGAEEKGPNIDSRVRSIRDLCSASLYALRIKWHSFGGTPSPSVAPEPIESPTVSKWCDLIGAALPSADLNTLIEVGRLLADLFEAGARIARIITTFRLDEGHLWGEIYREAMHIRDHVDYAADMVLDCIQPAD